MRWAFRIGLAAVGVALTLVAVAARAADQPKYATMTKGWSPAPQSEAQPAPPAPLAVPARSPDQPKYATMSSGWAPQPEAPQPRAQYQQQQPVQQQPVQPQPAPQPPVRTPPMQQASVAAQPPVEYANPLSSGTADYRLGTGDKVRVTVFGEDDLSGEFQVDSTGFLRMPMVGQVRAAGLTSQALEGTLTATYASGYLREPRVNVEVTTYRPFYIIGEVNKPGEYPYVNGMNVLNAVALAGGYSQKATEGHVYLRKNGTSKEIKVAADQTTRIMPGDIVRVTSNTLWDVLSIVTPLSGFAPRY